MGLLMLFIYQRCSHLSLGDGPLQHILSLSLYMPVPMADNFEFNGLGFFARVDDVASMVGHLADD
jgi:hypothetical protein